MPDGVITPGEGETIARIVDIFVRTVETSDFERRLAAFERAVAGRTMIRIPGGKPGSTPRPWPVTGWPGLAPG